MSSPAPPRKSPTSGPPGGAAVPPVEDEAGRVKLATNPGTPPETLGLLASDDRVVVRAAVALNPSAPDGAVALLALDADERVRQLLAAKLANLLPTLSRNERDGLPARAMVALRRLVQDEAERVRRTIAELVADMPDAPRDLILRLAHDASVPVSEPVIRLSPVLTVADLLVLLASPPTESTTVAIAAREGLPEEVADAIATSGNNAAIRSLLENQSAYLREAALDALALRAANQEMWHAPMVKRPRLSGRAAKALSEYVATHLLDALVNRSDLDPEIRALLQRRLADRQAAETQAARGTEASLQDLVQRAYGLKLAGQLDEPLVRAAAQRGEARNCMAMLAVASGLGVGPIERAAAMRSAKAVVSLAWTAGFSMELAVLLQTVVARVSPGSVLRSADGRGFPLAPDEMRWQLDLLRQMGR